MHESEASLDHESLDCVSRTSTTNPFDLWSWSGLKSRINRLLLTAGSFYTYFLYALTFLCFFSCNSMPHRGCSALNYIYHELFLLNYFILFESISIFVYILQQILQNTDKHWNQWKQNVLDNFFQKFVSFFLKHFEN